MQRPTHATVVASLALFVALGGTTYAGIRLGTGSVTGRHVRDRSLTARARKTVHVTVPLPAPGHAGVSIVTITARSQKRGAVGTLDVRATNASQVLQDHADAVAAIWPPSTKKSKAKFKVYVIMYRGNLGAASGRASAAATPGLGMNFFLQGPFVVGTVDDVTDDASCAEAQPEFTDHGPLIERLRTLVSESPIKPEEQRDQDIDALGCNGAEPVDAGND